MAMKLKQQVNEHRDEILSIAEKYGVVDIRLFGSILDNGNQTPNDIDFLINLESDKSILDLVGFQQEVEDLLDFKVDVVPENSLHWYLKDRILDEARPL